VQRISGLAIQPRTGTTFRLPFEPMLPLRRNHCCLRVRASPATASSIASRWPYTFLDAGKSEGFALFTIFFSPLVTPRSRLTPASTPASLEFCRESGGPLAAGLSFAPGRPATVRIIPAKVRLIPELLQSVLLRVLMHPQKSANYQ
jgi:hypothetical protein